jgi:ribonucleoside-diphosphate reductase alpha chain
LTGASYRRSAELARELGAFAGLEANREPTLAVIERHRAALAAICRFPAIEPLLDAAEAAWGEAAALGVEHGYRNSQVTLIPPAGTVSLMMDCETTGVEPYYSFATRKRFEEGGEAVLLSRVLPNALRRLGYEAAAEVRIGEFARRRGHLGGCPDLRPEHRGIFRTAIEPEPISAQGQLEMVAAVQPLVSGGVSKTVNVPSGTGVEEIEAIFRSAWGLGLKAVAVYRQGSKVIQPLSAPGDEGARALSRA